MDVRRTIEADGSAVYTIEGLIIPTGHEPDEYALDALEDAGLIYRPFVVGWTFDTPVATYGPEPGTDEVTVEARPPRVPLDADRLAEEVA